MTDPMAALAAKLAALSAHYGARTPMATAETLEERARAVIAVVQATAAVRFDSSKSKDGCVARIAALLQEWASPPPVPPWPAEDAPLPPRPHARARRGRTRSP
jgi:hypothetical protein